VLTATSKLLQSAQQAGYAVGAFNVYNLEGVKAVVAAAETQRSPAMLQIHPSSLQHGGPLLIGMCLTAASQASVAMSVQLDHAAAAADIHSALTAGVTSIMADGSHLPYRQNVVFTQAMSAVVHQQRGTLEAELGRLTGSEDGLNVPDYESRLTDPAQALAFLAATATDVLAVCIGNIHGRYRTAPQLDFERLAAIQRAVPVPLVLHGASGLPAPMVRQAIELGVCKFNVNTELREAYIGALREHLQGPAAPDLLDLMQVASDAMQAVVAAKLGLFGSVGKG
jgi:tagatose 1,6-diphosphate aldolase GatY/KbaY